jgi:serine/threonine-protein kinase
MENAAGDTWYAEASVMSVETVPRRLVVGRYVLEQEIGSGGMASVYLGRLHGAAGFSRIVAIKRLHPQYAKDASFAGAMMDEARLAARINHTNVVQIIDVLTHDGELLVVMELVQGETLARLMELAASPPPLDVAVKVALDLLSGLHAAHEVRDEDGQLLQLVHRDVSPQNVIVGIDGSARVIDFGVAKAIGRMQQTTDGRLKGKVGYFAPETVRDGQVDRRVDVYACGVVLWEMLTGRRLFSGENELQLLSAVLTGTIPPPSDVRADVPFDVDAIVLRALDKDPERRFQTAEAMADALEVALSGASARRTGDWVRRTAEQSLARRGAVLSILQRTNPVARGEASGVVATPYARTIPALDTSSRNAPATGPDPGASAETRREGEGAGAPSTEPTGAPVTVPMESAEPPTQVPGATPTPLSEAPPSPTAASTAHATQAFAVAASAMAPAAWVEASAPGAMSKATRPARKRHWPWLLAFAVLAAGVLLAALRWQASTRAIEPDAITAPAPPPEERDEPQAKPVPSAELSTPADSASAAPATASASAVAPPAAPPNTTRPPAVSKAPVRKKVSCTPPYTLDSRGIRIYKPECVRSPK